MLKKLFILSLIMINRALAIEVIAEGYGGNFTESLHSAKTNAIEQVVGSLVVEEKTWTSEQPEVLEKIKTYHSGYIKTYKIIEANEHYVKIRADVEDQKIDKFEINNDEFIIDNEIINNLEQKQNTKNFFTHLDNPNDAFAMKIKKLEISPNAHESTYRINYSLTWKQNWINQIEKFIELNSDEGKTQVDLHRYLIAMRVKLKWIFPARFHRTSSLEGHLLAQNH